MTGIDETFTLDDDDAQVLLDAGLAVEVVTEPNPELQANIDRLLVAGQ